MPPKKSVKSRLKELKKKSAVSKKRIQLKNKKTNISKLFNLEKDLYYSGFALTNNYDTILFFIDYKFLEKNNLTNELKEFNLNENDLQIRFDNKKILRPIPIEDNYMFNEIGSVKKDKLDWFGDNYPKCVFHQVTYWFGKSVNTLIIVLNEAHGKPVGVVKTYN